MSALDRNENRARGSISRRRQIVFRALLLAGTYLIVEAISLCAIYFCFAGWTSTQTAMEGAIGPDAIRLGFDYPDEIVHPYVGWVRRPQTPKEEAEQPLPVNDYGFIGRENPLQIRGPEKVVIGILGGSVAEQFAADATRALETELRKSKAFAGKQIVIVRLALSGYKQPQQLLIVNYLLSLGAQFDILINIDGYNEVVLPVVENAPNHVFDGFPRFWNLRVSEAGNLAVLRSIGRIALLKDQARSGAELAQSRPWCYSATVRLLWRAYHAGTYRKIFAEYSKLHDLKSAEWDYAANGPPQAFADDGERYGHCVQIWSRSSLQLHQLCSANDVAYYHFLQPNQHLRDSKPMGPEEHNQTRRYGHSGRISVETGYPLLIREGTALAERGVSFTDLTRMFVDHPEATYRDPCCHLNDHGNDLLAKRVAEVICETWPGR